MRPSLFVGSSVESVRIAEAVQRHLQHVADVTPWNQIGFLLNKPILDTLLKEVRRHDYAVFVFASDDVVRLRNRTLLVTRDNVMFELGMFISALGSERCFFLVPRIEKPFRIPTDLAGITPAYYDPNSHGGDVSRYVGAACAEVAEAIRRSSRLSGEWLLYIKGSTHPEPNGTMFVTCAGERATACLALRKSKEGHPVSRDFRYEGRYVAGQFAMTFAQGDAEDQIIGSIVFRANAGRTEMVGQTVFWHHDRSALEATEFALRRPGGK
jgi:hypothetical protein